MPHMLGERCQVRGERKRGAEGGERRARSRERERGAGGGSPCSPLPALCSPLSALCSPLLARTQKAYPLTPASTGVKSRCKDSSNSCRIFRFSPRSKNCLFIIPSESGENSTSTRFGSSSAARSDFGCSSKVVRPPNVKLNRGQVWVAVRDPIQESGTIKEQCVLVLRHPCAGFPRQAAFPPESPAVLQTCVAHGADT